MSMIMSNGAVVPPNLVSNIFIHFTCDNIDLNGSSLDGKNSFHVTQVSLAAWTSIGYGFTEPNVIERKYYTFSCYYRRAVPAGKTEGSVESK